MLFFHACFTSLKKNNKILQLFILCFHLSSICFPEVGVYLPLQCFTLLFYVCILKHYALLFHILKVKLLSHVRLFVTPWTVSAQNSPGQNNGVGSLSLLQQIFPTQESNWGLLHCRQILYQLNYQGNPILKLNPNILVKVKVKSLSRVRLFATPWTVAYQAPPSMEFSRQEYWSGLPFPSPEDLPNPGIEPGSPALQADALPSEPPGKP